jgi:uncharacterized protein (DUF488 family)
MKIYTIGHSTRSLEEFLDILKNYQIELVIDVRRFPSSKKFPHFNKDNLQEELTKNNIQYVHFPELGGYRKEGYLAFSQTEEFTTAIKKLLELIDDKTAAILCAEKFFWRCHRKYVSQYLAELGYHVTHILDKENVYEHKLSEDLKQKMNLKIFCDKIREQ